MKLVSILLPLLATGCVGSGAESPAPVADTDADSLPDADGDGLSDDAEAGLGTDPAVADTDGDGTGDGDEIDGNTDPLDADDKPYQGGYPKDACRGSIEGTGYAAGEVVADLAAMSQFGETIHLQDFCDHVVWVVFAAFW